MKLSSLLFALALTTLGFGQLGCAVESENETVEDGPTGQTQQALPYRIHEDFPDTWAPTSNCDLRTGGFWCRPVVEPTVLALMPVEYPLVEANAYSDVRFDVKNTGSRTVKVCVAQGLARTDFVTLKPGESTTLGRIDGVWPYYSIILRMENDRSRQGFESLWLTPVMPAR